MKKIISMIMVFVLLFGSVPVTVRAENETASETVPVELTEQTSGSENMSDTDEEQREAEKTEHAKEEETEPEETEPGDGASDVVTRIQWLHDLTVTFGMTVEEDNYPDNYYSDIDSASEYYYDVMLATEFGLVDAEAGEPFRPNDPATREFAAHTLNLCLGFRLEEESSYTFSESAEVTYPDDIQIAIDRGWFQLEDGAFHPEIPVTSAEKNSMLTSAAEIQASTEIDPNHTNQYGFSDGVIVLPEGTEIELTDENEFTITNCPAELSVGDLFAVVNHNFPVVKRVAALEVSGASTVITAESVDTEEAYTDLDLEGTMDVDLANVQAYDDSLELYYIVGGSEQAKWDDGVKFSSLQEVGDQKISAVEIVKSYDIPESVRSQYNLAPGVKANITCKISEVGVSYNSSLIDVSAYLNLNTTAAFTCNVSMDVLQAVGADSNITLAKVRVGYIGFMTVTLDLSLKGDITLALAEYISAGVQYKAKDGFRLTSNFRKKSFTISGQAEASAGITAEAGVDCVFIKGSIWGKIGGKTRVTVKTFDDGNLPGRCTHFAAWLYASVGCKIKLDIKVYKKNWGKTIALYDESNSPVKVIFHYEDGVPVDRCTRDPEGTYQYYTPADSQYGYNGASSGTGSDGELYTIFEYSLDDNNNATITSYRGNVAALVIPETIDGYTVVGIGSGVFAGKARLINVIVPDTITYIGSAAFKNCTSLNSVKLSSGLKTVGSRIFCNCTSLVNINIPAHIETVEDIYDSGWRTGEWFAGCDNLKAVTFDEGITRINRLFNNWTVLERIEIPETVTVIQAYAFADCTALKDVTIPDTVTEIGEGAFVNCRTIEEIEIPDSVIRIGSAAFKNCTSLNSVKLSSGLKTAGSRIFCNCTSLVNINIPVHIETVEVFYDSGWRTGEWFAGCDSLKEVTFDEGITRINRVFNNWTALERIEIPETVTTVGGAAFADCTSLKGVIIPDTVIKIGNDVFSGCTSLESAQWNNTISTIPDRTFKNCSSLTQFSLTPVITAIGADAFYGCSSLSELNWNENIAVIGSGVFRFCDALKDIVIPESVTTVSQYAFYNCSGLQSVVIGNAVTAIGKEAFYDCDALVSVRVANSVASMGTSVFYDCDALTDVTLGTGLTSIPASAFEHCDSLVSIVLPYRVASVGENAFKNCIKFTSITIPRATTSIAASAFSYPARMTIYGVSGTYAETYASENGIAFVDQTVPAAAVALSSTELTLNKGTAATLFMTVTPADFTDEVAWKSSNTSVATVNDSGVVTAAGLGTAIIKITVGNVSASCKVTVVQPVTSISLNQTSLTMDALDTFQLTANANPSDAYNREIVWSSSDETVAVVTEDGLVTAIGKGTATVTATAADGSGITRKCTVTVRNNAYVVANQGDLESPHPYDNNCSDMWVYTQNGVSELILNFDSRTELEEDFDFLHIYDGNGNEIGRYTGIELSGVQVTVPGDTVRIKLVTDNGGTAWGFKVNQPETPFTDVSQSAWYYTTVKEAYELGLMTGTTSTTFAPNSPMTRAMATAVLYRISGSPAIEYESIFTDVADGKYYSKCVTWAAKNKIVNGYAADNTFRPNANVTREQMAVILYNYAKFRRLDVSVQADLSSFHDVSQISSYARTAMSWAVGNKLMSGTLEGNLNPKNEATRAECAKMLLQTYKLIEGNP